MLVSGVHTVAHLQPSSANSDPLEKIYYYEGLNVWSIMVLEGYCSGYFKCSVLVDFEMSHSRISSLRRAIFSMIFDIFSTLVNIV